MVSRPALALVVLAGCDVVFDLEHVSSGTDLDGGLAQDGGRGDALTEPAKVVFLTSTSSYGSLGGLEGADAVCQSLAEAAGLPGTFMAWLSTSSASPATRMTRATTPYRLVTGALVANNWDDLVDGSIASPIFITERGTGLDGINYICQGAEVWSNTTTAGEWSGVDACGGWTSMTGTGTAARFTQSNANWTDGSCPAIACMYTQIPLYCVEQ